MSMLRRIFLSAGLAAAMLVAGAMAREAAAGSQSSHGTYSVVILPPNGGPDSFAAGYLIYAALNNLGTVGVAADTTAGGSNNYIWTDGRQADLQPLPQLSQLTGTNTTINWINQWGLVAGFGTRTDTSTGQSYDTAALWLPNGTILPLPTPPASTSRAVWVNDFGQASGWIAPGAVSDPCSFGVGDGLQSQAVIWEFGQAHPLGSLGGTDSYGEFINDLGQISGHAQTSNVDYAVLGNCPPFDPFVWQNGRMIDINPGNFGGLEGGTNYLNNHGQAVGFGTLAGEVYSHAFLWGNGKLTDLTKLGSLGAQNQEGDTAYNVNELGHVIGGSTTTEGKFLGVLWRNGEFVGLLSLSAEGDDCSEPIRINSRDQIVGVSFSCETGVQHAFIWENGSMADLNTLIPADAGISLVYAGWINDEGVIAGQGVLTSGASQGASRAVLLIPTGGSRDGWDGLPGAALNRSGSSALLHTADGLINPLILHPFDPGKLFHRE